MRRDERLFLAYRPYRQRRVADASRALPAIGLFLFLVPVLWNRPGAESGAGPGLAVQWLYAIGVIVFLAALAGLIAWGLSHAGENGAERPPEAEKERG
ncbi:MAG: hypothetical protein ACK5IB_04740 [Qingshengfaniella sp.]